MSARLARGIAACLALGLGTASAQETSPGLPRGSATLRGRIVHEGGGAVAQLPVVLYAAPAEGEPGLARTRTDASGGFAFDGISNDPDVAYLVGVQAEGIPFGTRTSFEPGETLREIEVRIAPPLADASAVGRPRVRLRIDRGCAGLRVVETHALHNPGDRVVFLGESQREGARPLLEIELPARASAISVPPAAAGIEQDASRVRFWGPLHPGTHEVEFAYGVSADGPDALLRWRFPQGADRVEVLTDERGPSVAGEGLASGPPEAVEGRDLAVSSAGPLEPGAELALRVALTPDEPSPIELGEARTWLELDDAALVVDQQIQLAVAGAAPLEARGDAPLLCIAIPPEAEALRFSAATLAMGAEPDASGELALRGPIPAGESSVALRYRIPVDGDATELVQRFDRALRVLNVLVADNGVAVETARLHRRRPVLAEDRSFLQLEGFQIEPRENVAIRLDRIAPSRPPPRAAALGFSVALAGAAVAFLVGPLRARSEEPGADPTLVALDTERESVLAALRSLEEDFETGKLDAADHAEMRAELRARAADLIQRRRRAQARAAGAGPAQAPGAAPVCGACGAALPADARFCHRCGAALPQADGRG